MEDLATGKRFVVGYFILYKNEVFTIEENTENKISQSENYSKLPKEAPKRISETFNKLDKWK